MREKVKAETPVLVYLSDEQECKAFAARLKRIASYVFIVSKANNAQNIGVLQKIEQNEPDKPAVILTTKAASAGIDFY